MKSLTEKQRNVLEAIKLFILDNGFPPTHQELKSVMGYKSANAIVDYLIAIEKKGYIKRTPKISRSIVVL